MNKKDIYKRKKVFFMKMLTNQYQIEYKCMSYKNANKEYKDFYNWLSKNCDKDKESVLKKRLIYLFEAYINLNEKINSKKISDEHFVELIKFSRKDEDKIKYFFKKSIFEYNEFDKLNLDDKEYEYYNNLLSWYSLKMDNIDMFIRNINRKRILQSKGAKKDEKFVKYIICDIEKPAIEKNYEKVVFVNGD